MIRISVVGRGVGVEQAPGASSQPRRASRAPAARCRRRRRPSRTGRAARRRSGSRALRPAARVRARAASSRCTHPLGMAAQPALLEAVRQRQLASARRRQRRQQLGVDEAVDQRRRRGEVADAPVRRQDLREAGDVDRALERVERGQPRRVRRREVRVGVVLDDVKVVLVRPASAPGARRAGRATRRSGCAAPTPSRTAAAARRRLRLDQAAHRRQVGPVAAARHRQHAHAERGQPRVLDRPAGLVDQHAVAGAQQGAGDDVERVRGADGGDDLLGRARRCRGRRA